MAFLDQLKKLGKVMRGDSWQNSVTGLGTSRDKRMAAVFIPSLRLEDQTLEDIFEGDALAARIVEKPVDDALRQGIGIRLQPNEGQDEDFAALQQAEADVLGAFDDLRLLERVSEGSIWGRLFGGCVIFPVLDDMAGLVEEPLNFDSIRKVHSLMVIDKRSVYPDKYDADPRSPTFGEPVTYRVTATTRQGAGAFTGTIHTSRLIVFPGARTSERAKLKNSGWWNSVLQRVYDALREFNAGFDNVGMLLHEGSIGVLKMKGLIEAVSTDGSDAIRTRLELMDMAKSVVRSLVLDAEGNEEYTREAVQFGSIPDVLDRFALRLAAAVDMPLTVLMGRSPAGMNATGESDLILWDNQVKTMQTLYLKPRIEQIAKIIMASKEGPTDGQIPDNWEIIFPPLRQMTDEQIASLRAAVAGMDNLYVTMGALTASQVASSRFGKKGWSMETKIDHQALEAEMEAEKEAAANALAGGDEDRTLDQGAHVHGLPGGTSTGPAESALGEQHSHSLPGGGLTGAAAGGPGHVHSLPGSQDMTGPPTPAPAPAARTDAESTTVQSVVLAKSRFETQAEASRWIDDHGFKTTHGGKEADETEESWRYRQRDPGDFTDGSMRSIELDDGVTAVIGKLKD